VLAFDRPGFGYSERPRTSLWTPTAQAKLILHALEELGRAGCGSWAQLGHDGSDRHGVEEPCCNQRAASAIWLFLRYVAPGRCSDLNAWHPRIGDLVARTVSPLAGRLISPAAIKASFAPAPIHQNFARFPLDMTLRPAQIRATAADTAMMIPAAVALSRHYADLPVPAIAMVGEGDLIAHADRDSHRLVEDLPRGELRIVPGQGHLFQ
jgi:pimeloyl-ACP methyl ester carboxylesterase